MKYSFIINLLFFVFGAFIQMFQQIKLFENTIQLIFNGDTDDFYNNKLYQQAYFCQR